MTEGEQLVVSSTQPDWGSHPQPRHVPWAGIEPGTSPVYGTMSNRLSHQGQGWYLASYFLSHSPSQCPGCPLTSAGVVCWSIKI